MQQILMPLGCGVLAGGIAFLISQDVAPSIGAAIGVAIGTWLVQRKQARPPA